MQIDYSEMLHRSGGNPRPPGRDRQDPHPRWTHPVARQDGSGLMSGDIHALSGAYAVDAVDDFERAQFERHLTGCPDCRLEVASLREGAALLAEIVAQPAPDALRDRGQSIFSEQIYQLLSYFVVINNIKINK